MTRLLVLAAGLAATIACAHAQTAGEAKPAPAQPPAAAPAPDLSKEPTLYVVGYAHLDTQWRWCYPQVIREFIPATLRNNFVLFEKYPNYVFNFSGSRRYEMMKEYYPQDYEKLREYIKAGRWFPCGSSVDENDANVPSAESQIRHVLYGNKYFRREFGVTSEEFMLPDCFGFPASLPSVLAHCGLKGFSTQKLTWNAVVPIPFKVGVWNGPDGRGVVAALDPGAYVGEVVENLANSNGWSTRIAKNGEKSGVLVDYHYYGVGDRGGAPTEKSVKMVEESLKTTGKLKVISSKADDMFKAISPELRQKLPAYAGELELTEHSAGSLTSATIMKRWNRKNEKLADAAERASVLAWTLGTPYPGQKLEDAWYLVLGSQMHDILPGTSHPYAYDYSQNDEVIAAGQFGDVLTSAVSAVESVMDTSGEGVPLVVYNPVSVDRDGVVEAEIPGDGSKGVVVVGPDGKPVPTQVLGVNGSTTRIAFLSRVPSVGFGVFHAQIGKAAKAEAVLKATDRTLENSRYKVTFNDAGDVASIMNKQAKRELLSAPITLQQCFEKPAQWPAWNQDWNDRVKPPMEVVGGPAQIRIVENGPARVAIEVTRTQGSSTFRQVVSLTEGDGAAQVRFDNTIDWNARERSLRVAFPLAVSNKTATWDGQTGTVERPNSHKEQFEYAGQQWMDLTDTKGDYGVTISNDCKYASDKPSDNTLRLTLLHTPGVHNEYQDQGVQDIGRHQVTFAVEGHQSSWREGKSPVLAEALNQPMRAFRVPAHEGRLGREVSLARVEGGPVMITALKKAEEGDLMVVRLRELSGKPAKGVRVSFRDGIGDAFEVDGQERRVGDAKVEKGSIVADLNGSELRAFAFKPAPRRTKDVPPTVAQLACAPLTLPYDTDAVSSNANVKDGSMEEGRTYPAEQFPSGTLSSGGVWFTLGGALDGDKQAVACKGQAIELPKHQGGRLYLLASAVGDDVTAQVSVDATATPVTFRSWRGYVGLWDRRVWGGTVEETSFNWKNPLVGLEPGFIKDASVAWYCSHHHAPDGDQYYRYCYLFQHAIDVPAGAKSVKLPDNPNIRIFAATLVANPPRAVPAAPLFDTLTDRSQDAPLVQIQGKENLADVTAVSIQPRLYFGQGQLRYTLDGSEPGPNSPEYTGPIQLYQPTTVKAALVQGGKPGPVGSLEVKVKDTTGPTVTSLTTSYMSRAVRLQLSEPAEDGVAGVAFSPAVRFAGVDADPDGRTFTVRLEQPLEPGTPYSVIVSGATDRSPAHNPMKPQTIKLSVPRPVYTLEAVGPEQMGKQFKVEGLPVKGNAPWTLNLFVKPSKQPEQRTIIAGFGECRQATAGAGRYLARFQGVHFWSHNSDVPSRTQLEVGKWQMLTASYDGKKVRLYKDGKQIGEREVALADDASVVTIAPVDPWDGKRTYEGEIRGMTIWPTAMDEESLKALRDTVKLE